MNGLARVGATAALTCMALLVPGFGYLAAAAAAEPERTGWWNRASAGGVALPQPQTQPGDLRIAFGPDAPTAYSAVLYTATGSSSATLDLMLREGSVVGTPEVAACPTLETEWPEGENQPYDKAPPYECGIGQAVGTLSADGKVLSFELDSSTQIEEGVWSLALVPQPDGSGTPFALDVEKPGPEAFVPAPPDAPTEPETTFQSEAPATTDSTSSSGSGEAFMPGGFDAAAPAVDAAPLSEAPLVAAGDPVAPAADAAPVVAAPTGGLVPFVTRPAGVVEDLGSGRRLLALLVLAGGSAAVGYAAGQQRPGPRLIGGRSKLVVPALATSAAAGPVSGPAAQERPRGIGRFAKVRDAAPRRLR